MHTCKVTSCSLLGLSLLMLTASCGGGGASGGGSSTTFVPGKWSVTLFSASGGLFANTVELDLDLVQSGNTISSDIGHTVDSSNCTGMHMDSSAGTCRATTSNWSLPSILTRLHSPAHSVRTGNPSRTESLPPAVRASAARRSVSALAFFLRSQAPSLATCRLTPSAHPA